MVHFQLTCVVAVIVSTTMAVQFPANPTSEMSADEKNLIKENKTIDMSDESGHEVETEMEEVKDKKFLDDAMKTVLDPNTIIAKTKDEVEIFKFQLEELDKENITLEAFMEEMDNLSLEVCKTSQEALWSYVTDIANEGKKNKMVRIAAEEDEIKKQYWNILKKKYLNNEQLVSDHKLRRKLRIIKERGTNVQMPQSKQREEIDTMQRIWSRVTVCAYNATFCNTEDSVRTMSDVISIFKTSNDTKELSYYWKAYRDTTGRKIRPIFKDYVIRMNNVAESENFTDAGDMWRYAFEDSNFIEVVDKIWREIKPLYDLIHDYVRAKLKAHYKDDIKRKDGMIPAHILGNLWAQDWQAIYPTVASFPEYIRPKILKNETIHSKDLFDSVDLFHQSLGFESARDTYQDIRETMTTANCLPSSHDMCDGVNYKKYFVYRIKWCGEKITDVAVGLSRAARLLGHVQYFKHYRHLPPLYRDGPNPAFHDAISDIVAVQLTTPEYLKSLNFVKVETGTEVTLNHLLWVALEKFPLMAYAYVLDKWRWDVFGNKSLENWNQHWWDLRMKETGVSPPVPRNESDLDPAAKYHVVSHVQYITYLISHVLEFQILLSLCRVANHTGPLHECSLYGVKEAGKLLSDGMSLGASEDWRTVLKAITGETELSTKGILEYFSTLEEFLKKENVNLAKLDVNDMDQSAPIIVGAIVVLLTILIIVLYCVKKHDVGSRVFSVCGLSKNGSLDIVTNEVPQGKTNEIDGISEDKV
ncbi:angiotensin-converting enzyme-like isoform X2 [Pectinophora gossypiella]|uniref:angiotensin-converting enzyme-like isoform X2 n=1 Tax=Pectinophora gossypiella TaxID=13191 RepID=UPI00214E3F62|nr:angiotensin-converting enzyme-like isoform X2 [Pectinophora gossypiella]